MTKILVVEDSQAVLNNIIDLLTHSGYQTYSALDAKEGLSLANQILPDLIISDIMMPGIDGFEFLERLKQSSVTDTIPFIFLTARVEKTDMRKGMVSGADDYVSKPFKSKELLEAIDAQLIKRNKRRRLFDEIYRNISTYVPHELRTPLVAIYGYTNMLLSDLDEIKKEDVMEMLTSIRSSTDRLYRTLEKFMMFSEVEMMFKDTEKYDMLHSSFVEVPSLVINEIVNKKKHESSYKIELKLDMEDFPVKIAEEHFRYLMKELIENAFKFSNEDPFVEIKAYPEPKNDKFCISILNRGRGMNPEEISKIHPFIQHQRDVFEQPGNGLGLITVKKILEFFKGELKIESDGKSYTKVNVWLNKYYE